MATALASTGVGASRVEMLFTAASMVGAVNSILGGVGIALLVRWAASIDTAGAVLVGVVATLVVFGLHLVWESRRGDAALGWRAEGRRGRGRPR
jgi:DNA-binding transcriptional LysR family regulator